MRLSILLCLIISTVAFFTLGDHKDKTSEAHRRAQRDNHTMSVKKAVIAMAKDANASGEWEKLLKNNRYDRSKFLSLELERAWISERPILVFGRIQDVASFDKDHNEMLIRIHGYDLYLALLCRKADIETFLAKHSNLSDYKKTVALAAKVTKTTVTYGEDQEGYSDMVQGGHGELIAITFVGEASLDDVKSEEGIILDN